VRGLFPGALLGAGVALADEAPVVEGLPEVTP